MLEAVMLNKWCEDFSWAVHPVLIWRLWRPRIYTIVFVFSRFCCCGDDIEVRILRSPRLEKQSALSASIQRAGTQNRKSPPIGYHGSE